MRFVFLDIDGVLLPYKWMTSENRICQGILPKSNGCPIFDANCVKELNRLCEIGNATIVVSSTWRQHIPCLETMRLMLREQGVEASITGMTPLAHVDWERYERGDEVSYFMEPLAVESFVILDDADMGWTGLEHRWVKTQGSVGLQSTDVEKALQILDTRL